MKHILYFILIGISLISCTERKGYNDKMEQAKLLIDEHPDSALLILDSLIIHKSKMQNSTYMKCQLLKLQAQNKAYVKLSSDSIAKELVDYYNNNGNSYERMAANYLLGCVYRDLGEVPHAVDCLLAAIEQADTTKTDYYNLLSTIYSQLGELYHNQLLLTNEVNARIFSAKYAKKANSHYFVSYEQKKIASAYILLNKIDSAELLLKQSREWFLTHGFNQDALMASKSLIHIYTNEHRNLKETKMLIDEFEASSNWFDTNHNLPPQKRMFYYYKGKYYLHCHQLDSAEYYFRKMNHPDIPYTIKDAMYKGLLEVFRCMNNTDSVSKYSLLYCNACDSSITKKDQELTAQISAFYNYNHYKREAIGNKAKANKYKWLLNVFVIIFIFVIYIISTKLRKTKEIRRQELSRLKSEYYNLSCQYNKNQETLQLLKESHQSAITAIEQEKEGLKARIEGLKNHDLIKEQVSKSKMISETDIVKRISYILKHPKVKMSDGEWISLSDTVGNYFPSLIHDLNRIPKITQQEMRTCILLCLSLRESDIAILLETSTQRITNVKSSLNYKLFKDTSARTLLKNLTSQYDIYTL